MFDTIVNSLLKGTPATSEIYISDKYTPRDPDSYSNSAKAVKVRTVSTGIITHHPSVHDVLVRYPYAYPRKITALLKHQGSVWKDIQVKYASDDSEWIVNEEQAPPKENHGGKFTLFLLEHKTTKELKIVTRPEAAKLLFVSQPTITNLADRPSSGRESHKWVVRYASFDDLKRVPGFVMDPTKMVFHKSVR